MSILPKDLHVFVVGLFCHFPWLIPIQHIIRGGRYLPAARPSNLSAVKNPLDVKVTRDESILLTGDLYVKTKCKESVNFVLLRYIALRMQRKILNSCA